MIERRAEDRRKIINKIFFNKRIGRRKEEIYSYFVYKVVIMLVLALMSIHIFLVINY